MKADMRFSIAKIADTFYDPEINHQTFDFRNFNLFIDLLRKLLHP